MTRYIPHSRSLAEFDEVVSRCRAVKRIAIPFRENAVIIRPKIASLFFLLCLQSLPLAQKVHNFFGNLQAADALCGLGRFRVNAALVLVVKARAANRDNIRVKVYVLPFQSEQLTEPESRVDCEGEEADENVVEQVLCFESSIDIENFCAHKSAIYLVLPEEDNAIVSYSSENDHSKKRKYYKLYGTFCRVPPRLFRYVCGKR